ncbi:flavin reductase family protein [Hyphomicrobium sp.]|uniref:flavin reductase family protein n=1 Tax=Hyphomicrobium sp. TaxID=82 RepID=UPI001D38A536|nr:flavin reductase family protein [Hyphomicrobium sp.]MBY0558548.1 flavin reductase family protein [Hyphomicrobium sp.]
MTALASYDDRALGVLREANWPDVSEQDFKTAVGSFPTGVVIVTGEDEDGPFGLTIQSFMSLSMVPRLVLISVARTSATLPRIQRAGRFCVNLLDDTHSELALHFAKSARGVNKFDGINYSRKGTDGSPVFPGSLGWIECSVLRTHLEGDHVLLVGAVKEAAVSEEPTVRPLIFWRSSFVSVDP